MKRIGLILLIGVLFLLASCTTVMSEESKLPLRNADFGTFPSEQYVILGNVTGEGEYSYASQMVGGFAPEYVFTYKGKLDLNNMQASASSYLGGIGFGSGIDTSSEGFSVAYNQAIVNMEKKVVELGGLLLFSQDTTAQSMVKMSK